MSRDWESTFSSWAKGPRVTEQQRCENAERQIRLAINDSDKLKSRNIKVFTQGSYRNRVNVRKDSDVDIGVLCYDTYFPEYPDDNIKAQIIKESRVEDAVYTYAEFKNELEEALVKRFGRKSVKRGDKAFDIKENSYRVESDVAAFFEHRRYLYNKSYLSGVEMIPDSRKPLMIRNWPEQHYDNGVSKNDLTSRKYKRIVRVLKSLSNEMSSKGIKSAKDTPSFLIECLVFNCHNDNFKGTTYYAIVRAVLAYLYNNTMKDADCKEWGEVSELKYLFNTSQPWTRESANKFLDDAWNYIGYK